MKEKLKKTKGISIQVNTELCFFNSLLVDNMRNSKKIVPALKELKVKLKIILNCSSDILFFWQAVLIFLEILKN